MYTCICFERVYLCMCICYIHSILARLHQLVYDKTKVYGLRIHSHMYQRVHKGCCHDSPHTHSARTCVNCDALDYMSLPFPAPCNVPVICCIICIRYIYIYICVTFISGIMGLSTYNMIPYCLIMSIASRPPIHYIRA